MLNKAIAKIRGEMDANKNNSYVQVVGNFLLSYLNEHPETADSIIKEGKTIQKSLDAMRKVAEKQKVGNCAVLTDAEGFDAVLNYFKSEEPTDAKTEKQKVKEITDKLEEGLKELFESEKYKSYLSTMSKFHNYSFNNTLLIAMS